MNIIMSLAFNNLLDEIVALNILRKGIALKP